MQSLLLNSFKWWLQSVSIKRQLHSWRYPISLLHCLLLCTALCASVWLAVEISDYSVSLGCICFGVCKWGLLISCLAVWGFQLPLQSVRVLTFKLYHWFWTIIFDFICFCISCSTSSGKQGKLVRQGIFKGSLIESNAISFCIEEEM